MEVTGAQNRRKDGIAYRYDEDFGSNQVLLREATENPDGTYNLRRIEKPEWGNTDENVPADQLVFVRIDDPLVYYEEHGTGNQAGREKPGVYYDEEASRRVRGAEGHLIIPGRPADHQRRWYTGQGEQPLENMVRIGNVEPDVEGRDIANREMSYTFRQLKKYGSIAEYHRLHKEDMMKAIRAEKPRPKNPMDPFLGKNLVPLVATENYMSDSRKAQRVEARKKRGLAIQKKFPEYLTEMKGIPGLLPDPIPSADRMAELGMMETYFSYKKKVRDGEIDPARDDVTWAGSRFHVTHRPEYGPVFDPPDPVDLDPYDHDADPFGGYSSSDSSDFHKTASESEEDSDEEELPNVLFSGFKVYPKTHQTGAHMKQPKNWKLYNEMLAANGGKTMTTAQAEEFAMKHAMADPTIKAFNLNTKTNRAEFKLNVLPKDWKSAPAGSTTGKEQTMILYVKKEHIPQ